MDYINLAALTILADRKPIDPPPVIKLKVDERKDPRKAFLSSKSKDLGFICLADGLLRRPVLLCHLQLAERRQYTSTIGEQRNQEFTVGYVGLFLA